MGDIGPPQLATIAVSGGTGNSVITLGGTLCSIGIKGPSNSVCDLELTDTDGFGVAGGVGLPAVAKIDAFVQVLGSVTVTITNATIDGTYKVKMWFS